MIQTLFPRAAGNRFPGHRLALWRFAIMLLKIAMGLNVMLNTQEVARAADGVPLQPRPIQR